MIRHFRISARRMYRNAPFLLNRVVARTCSESNHRQYASEGGGETNTVSFGIRLELGARI